jgi:hypothetical protein
MLGQTDEAVAAWRKGLEVARPGKKDHPRKDEVSRKLKANS